MSLNSTDDLTRKPVSNRHLATCTFPGNSHTSHELQYKVSFNNTNHGCIGNNDLHLLPPLNNHVIHDEQISPHACMNSIHVPNATTACEREDHPSSTNVTKEHPHVSSPIYVSNDLAKDDLITVSPFSHEERARSIMYDHTSEIQMQTMLQHRHADRKTSSLETTHGGGGHYNIMEERKMMNAPVYNEPSDAHLGQHVGVVPITDHGRFASKSSRHHTVPFTVNVTKEQALVENSPAVSTIMDKVESSDLYGSNNNKNHPQTKHPTHDHYYCNDRSPVRVALCSYLHATRQQREEEEGNDLHKYYHHYSDHLEVPHPSRTRYLSAQEQHIHRFGNSLSNSDLSMTQTNSWNGRMPNSNGTTNGARRSIMCYAPNVDQPPRYQQQQLDHSAHASAEHNPTSSSSSISKSGNHSFHVKFHRYGGSHQPNTTTTTAATTTDSTSFGAPILHEDTPLTHLAPSTRSSRNCTETPSTSPKTTQQQDSSKQHNVSKKSHSRSKTMNNNITSTRATTPPIDNNNNETSSNSPQKLASEVTSIHAAATNTTSNHHAHVPTTIPKSSSSSTTTTNIKFHMLEDPMLRANDDHRSNFVRIDEEQIRKVFHLTQRQAASFLGVSLSTLKRRFYEMRDSLKMDKWPTTAASQALNNVNTSSSATTSTTVSSSGKKGSNSKTTSPSQTPPPSSYQSAQQQPMPNMQLHRNESHHSTSNNYYSYSDRIQSQQDPSLMSMQGGGLVNNSTLTSPSAMLSHEMNKHDATSFTNNSYDGGEGMNYNVRFSRWSYPPCEQHPSYHQPQYHSHRNIPSSTSHSFYSNDQVTESTRMSSFSNQGTTNQAPQIMENPKYSLPKFVNTPPSGMFFENPLNNMFAATFASSTKMRASPSNIDSYPQQHSYSSALNPPPAHYIPREEHEEHSPIILPSISSTYPESIQHSHYTTLPTQYRELKSGCSSATLESSSHKISKPHKMKSHTNVSPTDEDDHARNGLKSNMSFILNHSVKDPTHLDSEEWNTLMNAFKHR